VSAPHLFCLVSVSSFLFVQRTLNDCSCLPLTISSFISLSVSLIHSSTHAQTHPTHSLTPTHTHSHPLAYCIRTRVDARQFNDGVAEVTGTSVTVCPDTPPQQLTPLTKHTKIVVDRGISFEMAENMLRKAAGGVMSAKDNRVDGEAEMSEDEDDFINDDDDDDDDDDGAGDGGAGDGGAVHGDDDDDDDALGGGEVDEEGVSTTDEQEAGGSINDDNYNDDDDDMEGVTTAGPTTATATTTAAHTEDDDDDGDDGEGKEVDDLASVAMSAAKLESRIGFFQGKTKLFGRSHVVLAMPANNKRGVVITRPNTGLNRIPKDQSDFFRTCVLQNTPPPSSCVPSHLSSPPQYVHYG
jgi:hypothetical protein